MALWFNNDSSYYVRNGWDPHDAAYCNTEMPITLSRAGFEYRPHSPGVPIDTQTGIQGTACRPPCGSARLPRATVP